MVRYFCRALLSAPTHHFDLAAVVAIRMMQMTLHYISRHGHHLWYRFVATVGSMLVRFVMTAAGVLGRASVGIRFAEP